MSEFNSHDHNIYYCGQESFWRNGVTFTDLKERSDQGGYTQKLVFSFKYFRQRPFWLKIVNNNIFCIKIMLKSDMEKRSN